MKLEFSRQIFEKTLKHQISWKPVLWDTSCSMRKDENGQNDKYDECNGQLLEILRNL